jgi:predicted porin
MSKSGGQRDEFRNTWSVGYDYPLSRRTIVYAAVLGDRATHFSSGYTVGGIRTLFAGPVPRRWSRRGRATINDVAMT